MPPDEQKRIKGVIKGVIEERKQLTEMTEKVRC